MRARVTRRAARRVDARPSPARAGRSRPARRRSRSSRCRAGGAGGRRSGARRARRLRCPSMRRSRSAVRRAQVAARCCSTSSSAAPQADDAGHVLGARPALPFLVAAVDQGDQRRAAPDIEHAHALGRVELVRRTARADRPRADRRSGRGSRRPARRRCGSSTPRARASRAISATGWMVPISLLASMTLTRHVSGRMRRGDRRRIDDPALVDGHVGHLHAEVLLEVAGRAEHRAVLDRRGDEMPPPRPGQGHALERQVVALGAAAGEDDLVRVAARARRPPGRAPARARRRRAGRADRGSRDCRTPGADRAPWPGAPPDAPGWSTRSRDRSGDAECHGDSSVDFDLQAEVERPSPSGSARRTRSGRRRSRRARGRSRG